MGKKHIIQQTKEEMIKEGKALEQTMETESEKLVSKKASNTRSEVSASSSE